jgi:hypothetical protein
MIRLKISMNTFSLIDAHEVFLIDFYYNHTLYHQDLFIATSEHNPQESLYQSALEFVLHNPQSLLQVYKILDEFDNPCIQINLENWEKNSRLICNNYDLKNYPSYHKEAFEKYLNTKEITPLKIAQNHFKEFLSDEELQEDKSQIEILMIEKENKKYLHKLNKIRNLTTLTLDLLNIILDKEGSLIFKVNLYPYFELQYPDKSLGIWLNMDTSASFEVIPELEGL